MRADRLIGAVGLRAEGPVVWGGRVGLDAPGVYVVEAPEGSTVAPFDLDAVGAWIERVPSLCLDGRRPTPRELAARLASFWIAGEQVVYIGLAGTSVARRTRQFYRTPLGDRRPHAGGHWVRTLASRDELLVWWAAADDPGVAEAALLAAFTDRHGGAMPFANRQAASGARKRHGITGSVIADLDQPAPRTRRASPRAGRTDLARINAALQAIASEETGRETDAVAGGAELERLGLLRDSASRPGKPLRDLLRAGLIDGAYQDASRRWRIPARPTG